MGLTKEFISNVKPKAIGQEIIKSTSAGQMIVKIVYDELVKILGSKNEELKLWNCREKGCLASLSQILSAN